MSIYRILSLTGPVKLCTRTLATVEDSIRSKLKRTVEKNILPPKPKKPLGPFLQYLMSVRDKLQKEYPTYSYQNIVKKASEQWVQADPLVKQNLQKQFAEQHLIYKQKLMDYENSITTDQKLLVKEELMKKERAWEKNLIKQKLVALGKPKRPVNAFYLFVQSKRATKDPQISQPDWMIKIGKEWKNMTMDAKNKYITEATKLYENYKIDMNKWEQNMAEAGYHDLLKPNIKSKLDTNTEKYKKQDLECPSQTKTHITESITADCSAIRTQMGEIDKLGWGTDTVYHTSKKISDIKNDQSRSTKSLVLYKENLQCLIEYPRNITNNASKTDDILSRRQVYDTYTKMYEHFIYLWNRFSAKLKEITRNWKMVREEVYTNTNGLSHGDTSRHS